ncbi:MAG: hypothetical protein H7246_21085 [Phycisphaerae bacterium]|nr:hypothetical protein [Saprospiraceae bacterium]
MKNTSLFSMACLLAFALSIAQTAHAQGGWTLNATTQIITTNAAFNNTPAAKVGIGMATPGAKLDIFGGPDWSSNHWQKALQIGNANAMSFRISPTLSFGIGASSGVGNGQGLTFFTTADGNASPSKYRMAINANGNVGIGTIAPEYTLDVRGSATIGGTDFMLGRNDDRPKKNKPLNRALVHDSNPAFGAGADNLIVNWGGDFEDGVVIAGPVTDVEGKLAVGGFFVPEYTLDVNGYASVGGSDFILGRRDGRPQKSNPRNRALVHHNGSNAQADNLVINFDGDFEDGVIVSGPGMVIGAPWRIPTGYMLAVGGKVICEELKVQLKNAWPDYVFGKGYKLPTLEEVERHIQAEQHLPGIPSACEVEENGISVGEMQTKMMEKIEELTLYIIDLNKENKGLQERVKQLEKQ